MGEAPDELKANADYIAPLLDQDGLQRGMFPGKLHPWIKVCNFTGVSAHRGTHHPRLERVDSRLRAILILLAGTATATDGPDEFIIPIHGQRTLCRNHSTPLGS